jgi:hypothetical protein
LGPESGPCFEAKNGATRIHEKSISPASTVSHSVEARGTGPQSEYHKHNYHPFVKSLVKSRVKSLVVSPVTSLAKSNVKSLVESFAKSLVKSLVKSHA